MGVRVPGFFILEKDDEVVCIGGVLSLSRSFDLLRFVREDRCATKLRNLVENELTSAWLPNIHVVKSARILRLSLLG
jgi:hypothetical protein